LDGLFPSQTKKPLTLLGQWLFFIYKFFGVSNF
jgi:hypothetical protein